MKLCQAKKNKVYKIKSYDGDSAVLHRLLELGFTRGQNVKILSTSLLKKVALIEIRGYVLSVRLALLNCIVVE